MNKHQILNLVYAAVCLTLAMVLPFLTGQIPQIGKALGPMHIAIFLCGFVCGWPYGMLVGFMAPLLRFALFGMPVIYPTGIAMAFELAAYGLISGLLYRILPKKLPCIYVSLISAMAGAVTNAIPGIILHIVLIPLVVIALQKANIIRTSDHILYK